jgi:hypothetical protein
MKLLNVILIILSVFLLSCAGEKGEPGGCDVPVVVEPIDGDDGDNDEPSDSPDRVAVCHVPRGNPLKRHTIYVSAESAEAHVRHGDVLGECN